MDNNYFFLEVQHLHVRSQCDFSYYNHKLKQALFVLSDKRAVGTNRHNVVQGFLG